MVPTLQVVGLKAALPVRTSPMAPLQPLGYSLSHMGKPSFHVMKLLWTAGMEVRRAEQKERPELVGSR